VKIESQSIRVSQYDRGLEIEIGLVKKGVEADVAGSRISFVQLGIKRVSSLIRDNAPHYPFPARAPKKRQKEMSEPWKNRFAAE